MGFSFKYTPPPVDPRVLLAAAVPLAVEAGAQPIFDRSQELVPVDTGELKASGRVEVEGDKATISYDATAPDGYPYGIRQHEDEALNHPNGGQAHYLSIPMSSEAETAAAAMAGVIRKALT